MSQLVCGSEFLFNVKSTAKAIRRRATRLRFSSDRLDVCLVLCRYRYRYYTKVLLLLTAFRLESKVKVTHS